MIGILGGTGNLGRGLALRLATAGFEVFIGSRSEQRGREIASELKEEHPSLSEKISGGHNAEAAGADMVFLTIPASSIESTLQEVSTSLGGKTVVDCTVSLKFGKFIKVEVVDGKSTFERIRELLPDSDVVTALKTVSAAKLGDLSYELDEDDFHISASSAAAEKVGEVLRRIGLRPVRVRGKTHALTLERMTALLAQLNKDNKGSHFGFVLRG